MIVSGTGRVKEDLILQTSKNGNEYVSFSLAHERGYGDNKDTDWYNCRVVGEAAKRIANLQIKKGTLLFISGELETPIITGKDGVKRKNININVLYLIFYFRFSIKATYSLCNKLSLPWNLVLCVQ